MKRGDVIEGISLYRWGESLGRVITDWMKIEGFNRLVKRHCQNFLRESDWFAWWERMIREGNILSLSR